MTKTKANRYADGPSRERLLFDGEEDDADKELLIKNAGFTAVE